MSDCLTLNISNNSNQSADNSVVKSAMDSVPQQTQQTRQPSAQQSPTTQLLIGQQISPIVSSVDSNQNSANDCSTNSSVNVSVNPTLISSNVCEPQNPMCSVPTLTVTSSAPSVSTPMSAQGSVQSTNTQSPQLIVSSQPQLAPTSQTTHLSANGLMSQPLSATITSMSNQTMQMAAQTAQHNQMQPLLQTSVQPSTNQMSVTMSQLPQVQVIQQPLGANGGTYQLQQVYPQGMILPGNLSIQNMNFQHQGLSLQIPFSGTGGVSTGTMPITSIAAKPPIMSKGVAISPLNHQQHHMISPLKPNMSAQQIVKQVLPQQFMPHSSGNQTVVISQLLPQQNQHSLQQSILPANGNKTLIEAQKGKQFGTASFRSAFGNKMLSHSAAIQPKSPILPATSISSSLLANSQFKASFGANANTTQLIQTPSNLITNPQILGSFQTIGPGLTWATSPQSTHLVAPNGSPIFIRGPTQGGEHMFISTSNMSSPHIQTVSMSGPINVQNSVHTPMQVSSASTQMSTQMSTMAPTHLHNSSLHTMSVTSNANSITTTTPISVTQPVAAVSNTSIANKTKILRQISSVATQTASPASTQKVESTTNLKPIAPAKPKPSAQQLSQSNNKQNSKDLNSIQMRSTSVGTTQTMSQPPNPPASTPAQNPIRTPSSKSDASNQTHKVSVATETPKAISQVSSTRIVSDQNRQLSVKSNTSSESSESKSVSVSESIKTPPKRPVVEKKDASTEQDMDFSTNVCSQNHKSIQNSVQTTNIVTNSVTQSNGQIPVLSDLNRQDLSKQPQKAIVKPQKSQILTHVIDGYIIRESANPFPVNGLSFGSETKILNEDKTNNNTIESIKSKNKNENSVNTTSASSSKKPNSERHLCLNCGTKRKSNSKNNRTLKRFCSQTCSEKFTSNKTPNSSRLVLYNSVTGHLEDDDLNRGQELTLESISDTQKQTIEEKKKCKTSKKCAENTIDLNGTKNGDLSINNEMTHQKAVPTASNSVTSVPLNANTNEESNNSAIAGLYIPPGGRNPLQWSVNDVYEFVRNLQGCTEYADEFRSQEIDGQALMLIKEDHLMNTMNMKLGPALKICSKINALREDVQKQS